MSMPRAVRHINEVRILDTLFRKGPMSRADLGRELGVMRSTAGNLVAGLVREGLLREDGDGQSGDGQSEGRTARAGRPGSRVELNGTHCMVLGADIGIGTLRVVAVDLKAEIVARTESAFDPRHADPVAVVDALALLIDEIRTTGAIAPIRGLTIAVAGLLDRHGNVMRAPILKWSDVPLLDLLRARLPDLGPIAAENDANAFAMAELYQAAPKPAQDALYVYLDVGVGGALLSDGQIVRGHHGYAGEIGHIPVGEDGFAPATALPGSLESFIGRDAIVARNRFHGGTADTLEQVLDALADGAASACATRDEWADYLGRGLATLTCIMNPARIVLGGAVAVLYRSCAARVEAAMRRRLLPDHPMPVIALSSLGPNAPALGAALMLHKQMLSFDVGLVFHGTTEPDGFARSAAVRRAAPSLRHGA